MTLQRDQRINDSHLKREAVIYVRQSTTHQVQYNKESTLQQLALREKAIAYGWEQPIVIDDDLGVSAAGYNERLGFQKLLAMVSTKQAGIIFCREASRLSRNSKDWLQLLQLCGFFDTLVSDAEQIYDLNNPNDRMVLGIKGTMSEMELSILKLRLKQGSIQKAERGELKFILPPGYAYDENDNMVMDPDLRIQQAIKLLFERFRKHTSLRQLLHWYLENKVDFPTRKVGKPNPIVWRLPSYTNLKNLLQHPIYTGAYAYGRRKTIFEYKDGQLIRKISDYLPPEQWQVLIKDHHLGYITWDDFTAIQEKISNNQPSWKTNETLGALREGAAILVGLLRCGHCGKKLYVSYKTKKNIYAMYFCQGLHRDAPKRCLAFGAHFVDQRISEEVLSVIQPAALEAGIAAVEQAQYDNEQDIQQAQLDLQNAEYQFQKAWDQYDSVDSRNRLVATTLEERLNLRIQQLHEAQTCLEQIKKDSEPISDEHKQTLFQLAQQFEKVWNDPQTSPKLKKQLLRTVVREIVVNHDSQASLLNLVIHWQGGVHTQVSVKKRKTPSGNRADETLVKTVKKLASELEDDQITRVLNLCGETTPSGLRWSKDRVQAFRKRHHIKRNKIVRPGMTAEKAAEYLGISRNALNQLVKHGLINTNQIMSFAPWNILVEQLDSTHVREAVARLKDTGRLFNTNQTVDDQRQLELFQKEL